VAAYFAAEMQCRLSPPGFMPSVVCPYSPVMKPFRATTSVIYKPPHISPENPAQAGLFTVHTAPPRKNSSRLVRSLAIGQGQGDVLLKQILNRCGVNERPLS